MNYLEHAREELSLLPADEMQQKINQDLLNLLSLLSNQGHSLFSMSYIVNLLVKLANMEPLTPLTGSENEWGDWFYTGETLEIKLRQNKRCGRVFQKEDLTAYDIEGFVFISDNGSYFTNINSHVTVEFPYTPQTQYLQAT